MFDISQIKSKYSARDRLDKLNTVEFLEEYPWTYFKYTPLGIPTLRCKGDPHGVNLDCPLFGVIFSKKKKEVETLSSEYTLNKYTTVECIDYWNNFLIASTLLPLNLRKNILNFFIGYYYLDTYKIESAKAQGYSNLNLNINIWTYPIEEDQIYLGYSPAFAPTLAVERGELIPTFFINVPKESIYVLSKNNYKNYLI